MSSDVFRVMFTSEFKENKMAEIPLPDKKFDDFLQLMQVLHPQVNKFVDETNVECILQLAQEYLILSVMKDCEKYLLTQPPSIHNLVLADKFSLSELRQVCIQYVQDVPYDKLIEDPEFELISQKTLCELFQNKLKLYEGKDPLKDVIYKITADPPSIKNLFLAEKHDVHAVTEKCLKYLKHTPLSQLKTEPGFTDLKQDTLNDVLTYKVETLEALRAEVCKVSNWEVVGQHEDCINRSYNRHYAEYDTHGKGTNSGCSECKKYMCGEQGHLQGSKSDCLTCNKYRLNTISEVMKKY